MTPSRTTKGLHGRYVEALKGRREALSEVIEWQFAALGLGIGMLTSLLGSLVPAARALNVRISNEMRE